MLILKHKLLSSIPGTLKILFTDYTNYGIMYECHREANDGFCETSAEHIAIMARNPGVRLTDKLLEKFAPYLGKACKEKQDLN